jgi:YD repeat-containing protein
MDGTSRTLTYSYREDGARSRIDTNFGYGSYFTYDAAGAMTSLSDGSGVEARFAYDAAGRRQSLGQGPNADTSITTYGYEPVGRLQSLGHDLAGNGFDQSYGFTYNAASQIVTQTATNDGYASNTARNVNRGYASNTAYNVARAYSVNGLISTLQRAGRRSATTPTATSRPTAPTTTSTMPRIGWCRARAGSRSATTRTGGCGRCLRLRAPPGSSTTATG